MASIQLEPAPLSIEARLTRMKCSILNYKCNQRRNEKKNIENDLSGVSQYKNDIPSNTLQMTQSITLFSSYIMHYNSYRRFPFGIASRLEHKQYQPKPNKNSDVWLWESAKHYNSRMFGIAKWENKKLVHVCWEMEMKMKMEKTIRIDSADSILLHCDTHRIRDMTRKF